MRDRRVLLLEAELISPAIVEWIGFLAAFCTTVAFVPQLVRVVKLKSAKDISLGTFLLFTFGVAMWLVYGLYVGSKPVIASNSVTFCLSLSILVMKLKYDWVARKELP
jgi:MtN3 and saliva related transmembrane protein